MNIENSDGTGRSTCGGEDIEQDAIDSLRCAHAALHHAKREEWDRSLPLGDLVNDRWERAQQLGFGVGSSIYDSAVVLGDVQVGSHCWIGPGTYLDGSGGLSIGDHVTIGVNTMLASHSSVFRDLSGGTAPLIKNRVNIGSRCFIGPLCLIEMGTELGDGCYVHALSIVRGKFPPSSILAGTPARKIGVVDFVAPDTPRMQFNRKGLAMLRGDGER